MNHAEIKKTWTSDLLLYEGIDIQNSEVKNFIKENIQNDALVTALSMDELLRPPTKTDNTNLVERLAKCLLSVAICFPNSGSKVQAATSDSPTQTEEPESKLRRTIIGFVCLAPLRAGTERHRSSSLAICVADAYQAQGYGGEAINWALDWGFRHANLHRIDINAASFNTRAVELYQKLGFIIEGRRRESLMFDQKWYDHVEMSMLEDEWEALRRSVTGVGAKSKDGIDVACRTQMSI